MGLTSAEKVWPQESGTEWTCGLGVVLGSLCWLGHRLP